MNTRNLFFKVLGYSRLLSFFSFFRKRMVDQRFGILVYHEIKGPQFLNHMYFLLKNYRIISLDELYDFVKENCFPRSPSLVITFDDGARSFYESTFPAIKKIEIPVTHYITTGGIQAGFCEFWWKKVARLNHLGARINVNQMTQIPDYLKVKYLEEMAKRYNYRAPSSDVMSNEQLKEIDENGLVTLGAHSVTHPCLTKISPERAQYEITESKRLLEGLLHHKVKHFAYPDGDYNGSVEKIVISSGFETSVIVEGRWLHNLNPYRLSRVGTGAPDCSVPWLNYNLLKAT